MITQDQVRELFNYRNGKLYWKATVNNKTKKGNIVGTRTQQGYYQCCINYKIHLLHRVIFVYHYGYLPKVIDHIDGNPSNNKIENLREATGSQNNYNSKLNKRNLSGVKGVSWDGSREKWIASITVAKKQKNLGRYDNIFDAACRAMSVRNTEHGEFASSGICDER